MQNNTNKNSEVWRNAIGKLECPGDNCPRDCDETCPIYLNTLALLEMNRGAYEKAIPKFQRILSIAPDFDDCWSNLGSIYGRQKKYSEAYNCYVKAHELAVAKPNPVYGLLLTTRDQKKYEECLEWCNIYSKLSNDGREKPIRNEVQKCIGAMASTEAVNKTANATPAEKQTQDYRKDDISYNINLLEKSANNAPYSTNREHTIDNIIQQLKNIYSLINTGSITSEKKAEYNNRIVTIIRETAQSMYISTGNNYYSLQLLTAAKDTYAGNTAMLKKINEELAALGLTDSAYQKKKVKKSRGFVAIIMAFVVLFGGYKYYTANKDNILQKVGTIFASPTPKAEQTAETTATPTAKPTATPTPTKAPPTKVPETEKPQYPGTTASDPFLKPENSKATASPKPSISRTIPTLPPSLDHKLVLSTLPPTLGLQEISVYNGEIIKNPTYKKVCPLEVFFADDSYNKYAYIYLKYIGSPRLSYTPREATGEDRKAESDISFIVGRGQSTELKIPIGKYEIYYCTGDRWYGPSNKFCKDDFYKFDELFDFYTDHSYINGYTLEIMELENGNLEKEKISESEFPD